MAEIIFNIKISPQQFLQYYRGSASSVTVTAEDGRRIRLPARHLRPFLRHDGIKGRFKLTFADNNRLINLERL